MIDAGDALGGGPAKPGPIRYSKPAPWSTSAGPSLTPSPPLALSAVELLPPVPDPEKIVCIGLNYGDHAARRASTRPASPSFFGKFSNALIADGEAVRCPATSTKVDYEAEVRRDRPPGRDVVAERCDRPRRRLYAPR